MTPRTSKVAASAALAAAVSCSTAVLPLTAAYADAPPAPGQYCDNHDFRFNWQSGENTIVWPMGEDTLHVHRCADEKGTLNPGSVQVTSHYVPKGVMGHFLGQTSGQDQITQQSSTPSSVTFGGTMGIALCAGIQNGPVCENYAAQLSIAMNGPYIKVSYTPPPTNLVQNVTVVPDASTDLSKTYYPFPTTPPPGPPPSQPPPPPDDSGPPPLPLPPVDTNPLPIPLPLPPENPSPPPDNPSPPGNPGPPGSPPPPPPPDNPSPPPNTPGPPPENPSPPPENPTPPPDNPAPPPPSTPAPPDPGSQRPAPPIPGAPGPTVYQEQTWGHNVNIRRYATTNSQVINVLKGPSTIHVQCQVHGQRVVYGQYDNDGWSYLPAYGGWISNIFISGNSMVKRVPDCGSTVAPQHRADVPRVPAPKPLKPAHELLKPFTATPKPAPTPHHPKHGPAHQSPKPPTTPSTPSAPRKTPTPPPPPPPPDKNTQPPLLLGKDGLKL